MMIYVILEQRYNCINPVRDEFMRRYNKNSIYTIGGNDVSKSDLELISKPPLFNSEWLIICSDIQKGILSKLQPNKNNVIIQVYYKRKLQSVVAQIGNFNYKIIDNYDIDPDVVKVWLVQQLGISKQLASKIYSRTNGNLKLISEGVQQLRGVDVITGAIIEQYIEKGTSVSFYSLIQFLLGIDNKLQYKDVVDFLYNFRYTKSWLSKGLADELQLYLEVYKIVDRGNLDLSNFREFKRDTDNAIIRQLSEYRLQKMIENHKAISTEYVYFLWLYCKTLPAGIPGIRKILDLIKIGGSHVYSM